MYANLTIAAYKTWLDDPTQKWMLYVIKTHARILQCGMQRQTQWSLDRDQILQKYEEGILPNAGLIRGKVHISSDLDRKFADEDICLANQTFIKNLKYNTNLCDKSVLETMLQLALLLPEDQKTTLVCHVIQEVNNFCDIASMPRQPQNTFDRKYLDIGLLLQDKATKLISSLEQMSDENVAEIRDSLQDLKNFSTKINAQMTSEEFMNFVGTFVQQIDAAVPNLNAGSKKRRMGLPLDTSVFF